MREVSFAVSVIRSVRASGGHRRHTDRSVSMSLSASILYGKRKMRYVRRA